MKFSSLIALTLSSPWFMLPCARAEVRLPHIFGDHMVLQQEKPIIIWGWADPNERVSVTIDKASEQTQANAAGEWKVSLPAMKAGGGAISIQVVAKNTITLQDVLIGEVWLCSGQSNMEMGVGVTENGSADVSQAKDDKLRLFTVPRSIQSTPQRDVDASWKLCTPESVGQGGWGGFSAAGYFFGLEIRKALGVPVGLISSNYGGTQIKAWTPPEGFAAVPALKDAYAAVVLADPRSPEHREKLNEFLNTTATWMAAARAASAKGEVSPLMPIFPPDLAPLTDPNQATALYNGMIHPLQPLSMRGILWYQGESDHLEGMFYVERTKALVEGWRQVFVQPDLPFFYTLIAPYNYGEERANLVPEFWEAQLAAQAIPNTGIVITTDIGDINDIHPKRKREVGQRLALLALNRTYGKKEIVPSGPIFKKFAVEGEKMRITFDHAGGGLIAQDGKPLSHFEIIDAKRGAFVPANAVIDGESVILSAPEVKTPAAVRFGWHKTAQPNLFNKSGLPAAPFRAGEVPVRDELDQVSDAIKGYELVYDLDVSKITSGDAIPYSVDARAQINKPFDRVAYFVELTAESGQEQHVLVSMDAFTDDLGKIGLPTLKSGASFQKKVTNLTIVSNVPGLTSGESLSGGNIEFWPNDYGATNSANIPNASSEAYDFGDQIGGPGVGYGSMQIHNYAERQTVFALNNWNQGGQSADIGIGNGAPSQDWTFAKNAGTFPSKRVRIFVRTK